MTLISKKLERRLEELRPLLIEQGTVVQRPDRDAWVLRYRETDAAGVLHHRSLKLPGNGCTALSVKMLIERWRLEAAPPVSELPEMIEERELAEQLCALIRRFAASFCGETLDEQTDAGAPS